MKDKVRLCWTNFRIERFCRTSAANITQLLSNFEANTIYVLDKYATQHRPKEMFEYEREYALHAHLYIHVKAALSVVTAAHKHNMRAQKISQNDGTQEVQEWNLHIYDVTMRGICE